MKYVVAVSQDEANSLSKYGYDSQDEADAHLRYVQAPPTDPFYAAQYKVWSVGRCNHSHVTKGPCVLKYGHKPPHSWNGDLPADRCGGDGTYLTVPDGEKSNG